MSEPQVLFTGLAFGESPRWHDGRVWVSDWGAQEIVAIDPDGKSEVMIRVLFPSFPMCFDFLPTGQPLILSGRGGQLLRLQPDGSLLPHADLRDLTEKRPPWNEVLVDGRANVYVNAIGFEFPGGEFAPGSISVLTPEGSARQVVDGLAFPNGMAVTPDDETLIVAESYANRLTAFDIAPDGMLSNRRLWAETGNDHPDGICLDADGAVWYGDVGNKRCVRVREGGEVLQTIELDRGCFACMLGGANGRTLFMVATNWRGPQSASGGERTGQVLTLEAPSPRAGWP